MKKFFNRKKMAVCFAVGFALTSMGCGRSDNTDGSLGYMPGSVSFCQPGMTCTDLTSACSQTGGFLQGSECLYPINSYQILPLGSYAQTGVSVRAGDIVRFVGSGYWATLNVSSGSTLFGLINYSSSSCSSTQNVFSNPSTGLFGTDGISTFLIGDQIPKTIQNNGIFKFGLNLPSNVTQVCGALSYGAFVGITSH